VLDDWEKEWGKNSQRNVQPKLLPVVFRSPLVFGICREWGNLRRATGIEEVAGIEKCDLAGEWSRT